MSSTKHGGFYYAYATQSGRERNIQVARTRDHVRWQLLPRGALAEKPAFAQNCQDFWAPSPVVYEDRRYRFYYTLRADGSDGFGISVATSDRPDGGFVDPRPGPLKQGKGFSTIDPHYLVNPRDGRKWLYWGSHETPIVAQELRDDGMEFRPGSAPRPPPGPSGPLPQVASGRSCGARGGGRHHPLSHRAVRHQQPHRPLRLPALGQYSPRL